MSDIEQFWMCVRGWFIALVAWTHGWLAGQLKEGRAHLRTLDEMCRRADEFTAEMGRAIAEREAREEPTNATHQDGT